MSFGRTKIFLSFALIGFLIGAAIYFVFDWLFVNSVLGIEPVPILEVMSSPWFLSGIAGSFLSIIIVYASARFSYER